jgi:predicted dehydrogenase
VGDKISWGILGTGNIAHSFARGLPDVADAELLAVGSRSQRTADAFGEEFNVPRRYSTYEDLANDPDVDVVYISSPHTAHFDNSMLCLRAGKAVLCEKPFTINAIQAEELIAYARSQHLFLMEAVWTRFLPVMERVRGLLSEQAIGEPRMLAADFGFRTEFNPKSRLFDPALGGGALLDVGIYPVSLASMVFGEPTRISSMAHLGETGVDEQSAMILGYSEGQLAMLYTAIRTSTPHDATIMGSAGSIKIHAPWWQPTALTLIRNRQEPETIDLPFEGNGYGYEARAVGDALRAGRIESPVMPLDETLAVMRTMDTIRAQWGLKYPME